MRGLKLYFSLVGNRDAQSHPVWVRGLKLSVKSWQSYKGGVAPCMGAWIETNVIALFSGTGCVAPCMGAWIETSSLSLEISHLEVAPCMGAWIETRSMIAICMQAQSHPVWVRGLKPTNHPVHPVRHPVAPCMGAWIET